MQGTRVTNSDLLNIKSFIETIRFGSVNIVIQDGKIIQIDKHEKIRLENRKTNINGA